MKHNAIPTLTYVQLGEGLICRDYNTRTESQVLSFLFAVFRRTQIVKAKVGGSVIRNK